jgi:hypothetical protein
MRLERWSTDSGAPPAPTNTELLAELGISSDHIPAVCHKANYRDQSRPSDHPRGPRPHPFAAPAPCAAPAQADQWNIATAGRDEGRRSASA